MSDIQVGDSIGSIVGSNVEISSIGGTKSHIAQLSAGLNVNGVNVTNAPEGHIANFALANALGYAPTPTATTAPALALKNSLTV